MKRFLSCLLSYMILLQGCAGTRPLLIREIPREECVANAQEAYQAYAKTVKKPQHSYELLNLGVLAYEAGDWPKSAFYLTQVEDFTHHETPLFEQVMLHYYRGLAYLEQANELGAQRESERIIAHLSTDTTTAGYHYGRWCAEFLTEASDTAGTSVDSGRVIILCETGLMPRLSTGQASVLVYSGDQYYPPTDSSLKAYGQTLRKRWLTYEHPEWPASGYVSAELPQFLSPPSAGTEVQSVETIYDSSEHAYPALTVNIAEAETDGMAERQAQTLAMAPIQHDLEEASIPPEHYSEDYVTYTPSENRDRNDRGDQQPEKREGRRQQPEPEKKKDSQKATTKDQKADESSKEKKPEEKKEEKKDDGGGAGTLALGIAAILVAGVFIGAYYGTKAVVEAVHGHRDGQAEPSWEMLPVKIFATTLTLPPGTHDVRVVFKNGNGEIVKRYEFQPVVIEGGKTVVARARCME